MIYYVGTVPCGVNDLSHHGILGMKWGVRRYQNKDGTRTAEGKRRYNSGETQGSREMSDDDLRKSVNRMRTEVEYNRLSRELNGRSNASKALSVGAKVAGKILSTAGYVTVSTARVTVAPLASNFFREMGTGLGRSMFGSGGNNGNGKKKHKDDDED